LVPSYIGVITHTDFGVVFGAFGWGGVLCGNDRKPDTRKLVATS
jgi:hypothetical protein